MTNEVLNTIKNRRSIRAYKPDAVAEEAMNAVLEAGTFAPTGGLNAEVMGSDSDPYYGAPVVVLVLADGNANTFIEDGSCVLENMMIAAASLGLGSVWVHREREIFDSTKGKALLKEWGYQSL